MSKVKILFEFQGSNYFGWQKQKGEVKTVQREIERALEAIYKERVKTVGSGRTDAKVHSLHHHAVFTAPFEIPVESIVLGLNSHLPLDIRVVEATSVPDDFNITRDAKSREYRYLFTNNSVANAFQTNLVTNLSYDLNIDLMKQALKVFEGTHDFSDFHTKGSNPSSTIRTIFETELLSVETNTHGIFPDHYCVRIVGNGFLKQMVRLIVSSCWKVGQGKLSISEIERALKSPSGKHLAPVAPGVGLYKYHTKY